MILQGSSPGVQDAEEAGEIGADMLSIEGEFFDGIGGSLEQSGVSQALVCRMKKRSGCGTVKVIRKW